MLLIILSFNEKKKIFYSGILFCWHVKLVNVEGVEIRASETRDDVNRDAALVDCNEIWKWERKHLK